MADLRIPVLIFLVLVTNSESYGGVNEFISNIYDKIQQISCQDTEICDLVAEVSYGCHTFTVGESTSNTSCFVKSFSDPDFVAYLKPGENLQYLELELLFFIFCLPDSQNNVRSLKFLPKTFRDLEAWHELKVQRVPQEKSYYILIDGEKYYATPKTWLNITASKFVLKIQGSSSLSFGCDPRDYPPPSQPNSMPFWVINLLTVFLIIVVLAIYVFWTSKKNSSASGNQRSSSEPSSTAARSVMFQNRNQNLRGGYPSRHFSVEHVYEDADDVFVDDVARPVDRLAIVDHSVHPPQQQRTDVSTINSLYIVLSD